jgi:hypothetical protein
MFETLEIDFFGLSSFPVWKKQDEKLFKLNELVV